MSIISLGIVKILLSIICGRFLINIVDIFPKSILGILIIYAGLELAVVGASKNHDLITLGTAASCMGTNTWIGTVMGCIAYFIDKKML